MNRARLLRESRPWNRSCAIVCKTCRWSVSKESLPVHIFIYNPRHRRRNHRPSRCHFQIRCILKNRCKHTNPTRPQPRHGTGPQDGPRTTEDNMSSSQPPIPQTPLPQTTPIVDRLASLVCTEIKIIIDGPPSRAHDDRFFF